PPGTESASWPLLPSSVPRSTIFSTLRSRKSAEYRRTRAHLEESATKRKVRHERVIRPAALGAHERAPACDAADNYRAVRARAGRDAQQSALAFRVARVKRLSDLSGS